jgi:hypothetical protein
MSKCDSDLQARDVYLSCVAFELFTSLSSKVRSAMINNS